MTVLNTDKVQAAREIAETVLAQLNCYTEDQRKKSKEIYQYAKEHNLFENLENLFSSDDSLASYLSFAKSLDNSRIAKPAGRQGYYISKAQEEIIKKEELTPKEEAKEKKERDKEKLLYPLLVKWLQTQGYRSKDTSTSKSLGRWGNPDVSGIKTTEFLGSKEIEITTVEAKLSIEQWEYNIFEAISHRRFANRSYFAFAHPFSLVDSLPSSLRYYCELYNIGLVIVSMSDDFYEKFINGSLKVLDSSDEVEITEYYSAPYTKVPVKYQKDFCSAIGIRDTESLYTWGSVI